MMGTSWLRPSLRKEVAGLLPVWGSCVVALISARIWPDGLLRQAAIVAYIAGPLAIGAHALGQEHSHRTLGVLLSQPIDRRCTFLTKWLVAASMIMTIAALAPAALARDMRTPGMWQHFSVQVLPLVGGLGAAPWLALICRSTLAGLLFTASTAAMTLIAGITGFAWWSNIDVAAAQAAIVRPWALTMIALCAVGGVLGARCFIRLEVIDGPVAALTMPRWLAPTTRRRRSPIAALVLKELHLQQLTFVLAAVFAAVSLAISLLRIEMMNGFHGPVDVMTMSYCGALAILSGALASAEERQHRTIEWQLLQPTPAWQQWSVKVAVTFGLALLFGAALPALLLRLTGSSERRIVLDLAPPVALITAATLYLSSLVTSGVAAMVLSLPTGVAAAIMIQFIDQVFRRRPVGAVAGSGSAAMYPALPYVVATMMVVLLVRFAFVNHTSIDRQWRRIVLHVAMLGVVVAIGTVVTLIATD